MINETESGLTTQEHLDVQSATGDLSIEVNLQRYGPVWTSHDTGARTGACFDAIIAAGYLVRAHTGTSSDVETKRLASESGGAQSWAAVTNSLTDVNEDIPFSLADNGNAVRLFYYSGDGKIRYTECADITAGSPSFGAPQDVGAVANVVQLAAVSTTKVHYITKNSNNNRVLHVYEFNGSWSSVSSDIYWPFPVYAFDAETVGDFDLLMLASELSPLLGTRAIGTEITTEVNRVQGLVTFRVKNGRWSDHQVIDVIDKIEVSYSRTDLRLSYVNSILFACYERSGGGTSTPKWAIAQSDYTYTKTAITRSKDGENWEFPEFLTGDWSGSDITAPVVILPRSDYLYGVGLDRTAQSPCCAWAGQTPVELDVTDYTTAIESQARDIRNSTLTLANPDDTLAGSLAKSDDRIQAIHDIGYMVSGSGLRMTVSTEDIVSRREAGTLPANRLTLHSQDRLGRLNRITSDYAAEWPSQQAGRDTYDDPSGTGYGGMRHTANIEGSWKTPKDSPNEIHLKSSNKEGLAVSTFVADALNGSDQTAFKLHTDSQGELGGLSFRLFDKDNLFFVAYYLDDDAIKLVKGVGGDDARDDTVLATSSAMSWVKDTWYWLKVRVRYSLVYVYYSTDGITWTLLSSGGFSSGYVELAGTPVLYEAIFAEGKAIVWSGKFGLIGYGYSDDDTGPDWDPEPWVWPEPYVPQYWGMLALSSTHLARAWNFFTHTETTAWTDITGAMAGDKIIHVALGPSRQAYVTTDGGVYYTGNIAASSPTWQCLKTRAQARTDTGNANSEFRSVHVGPDGTVYLGWHHWGYGVRGYWSGNAGGINYTTFALFQPGNCHISLQTHATSWGTWVDPVTGTFYFTCYGGGCAYAVLATDGTTYTQYAGAGQSLHAYRDGFAVGGSGNLWSSPGVAYATSNVASYVDVLNGEPLYVKGGTIYRATTALATVAALFGSGTMRPIFTRGKRDEIAVAVGNAKASPNQFIVYTADSFTNYHDKTGDYYTSVGNWAGDSVDAQYYQNAQALAFPYSDEDYP